MLPSNNSRFKFIDSYLFFLIGETRSESNTLEVQGYEIAFDGRVGGYSFFSPLATLDLIFFYLMRLLINVVS